MQRLPVTVAASASSLACALAVVGGLPVAGATRAWAATSTSTATGSGPTPTIGVGGDGADFLVRQLAAGDGLLDYPGTDQPDLGVTADAVLGLLTVRSGPTQAVASVVAVEARLGDYLGPSFGATELYAGPVAKVALLAESAGRDARSFGGRDLVADLQGLEAADGRFADRTAYGDTSNTFTQALAIIALHRIGEKPSASAVDFLLAQQCSDGGLRMTPGSEPCTSDPDAASLGAVALLADGSHGEAADRALTYLTARQQPDGGLGGGIGATGVNTNSTGLAGMAFKVAGRDAPLRLARDYLASVQLGCDAPMSVRGAIAYDRSAYDALVAAGASATASDQERRATAQGMLAFGDDSLLNADITQAAEPLSTCDPAPTQPPPTTGGSTTWSTGPGSTSTTSSTSPSTTSTSTPVTTTPSSTGTGTSTTSSTSATSSPAPSPSSTRSASSQPMGPTSTRGPAPTPTTTESATQSASDTASVPATASTTTPATAAAQPAAAQRSNTPALLGAAGLALLGAAIGALILRRERKNP